MTVDEAKELATEMVENEGGGHYAEAIKTLLADHTRLREVERERDALKDENVSLKSAKGDSPVCPRCGSNYTQSRTEWDGKSSIRCFGCDTISTQI